MRTLKTYAHAMKEEEADLSFANFGSRGRPDTAPLFDAAPEDENAPDPSDRGRSEFLERETGPAHSRRKTTSTRMEGSYPHRFERLVARAPSRGGATLRSEYEIE